MKQGLRPFSFFIVLVTLCGCQTMPADDFARLQPGMEKADVLDIMGSPQRTQRWHGMDRWTYIYYQNVARQEKEVHFADGRATYVGGKYEPPVSAEEQDRIFANENAEIEKTYAARREEFKRSGLPKFQEEVDGSNEIRYVPQFEPVK